MQILSFFAFCCYHFVFFSGIQLWFQNGFFNVVFLGTEIFFDGLINFGLFPCFFFVWSLINYGKCIQGLRRYGFS